MKPSFFPSLLLVACALGVGLGGPASAQEAEDSSPPEVTPSGSARLMFEGQQRANVGFSLRSDGPRFAISPIAELLGTGLRVGPLGEAHTLILADKQVVLGPDDPTVVTVSPDGSTREEIWRLQTSPIRSALGLEVPLEFLRRTFGEELGYEFRWDFRTLELTLERRELRELTGALELVHQHRASTLEIFFSQRPRFRFDELPGAVEIRLVGDSLTLSVPFSRPADPLVNDVVITPTRIRLKLAEDAKAFEPRLVPRTDGVSMVIDIFRQRSRPRDKQAEKPAFTPLAGGIRTIVLDPGHGGPDETGAVGATGTYESKLTLMMARLLRTKLEQRMPVRVVLTRERDEEVSLTARTALANENKADLFISLHFNSYRGTRARGAETYFLSREASDELAAQLAAAENRDSATDAPETAGDGLDLILWDLAQSYHLNESQRFANLVQEELNQALALRDRGVRQAPFKVLMGATMPAVLVELGFISNPQEEAKLRSPAYRAQLADALVRAVVRFKTQLEARDSPPREAGAGPAGGGSR
ncbi:MAG: N-acetylmuramoyl-L-alanine amidase [Acidobacteriota bacterium]